MRSWNGNRWRSWTAAALLAVLIAGCRAEPRIGETLPRRGQEMMVCGQLIHVGAPVVLWTDPGGYDAYRVERRFVPLKDASWTATQQATKALTTPNRYNTRRGNLTDEQFQQVRGGGWSLPLLQSVVDQFVIHYDVCGTARQCFNILHDHRGLSVHFMLDIDGTIYQTLDLKERAWHASSSNDRSVGIEIANIGAYAPGRDGTLAQWYAADADGRTRITLPKWMGDGGVRTPDFVGHPARPQAVEGEVQGRLLRQYDLTDAQYESLIRLTAALCRTFPNIKCDYPRDAAGKLITRKLPDDQLNSWQGLIGHYHITTSKIDPGPAFDWDRLVGGARRLMDR